MVRWWWWWWFDENDNTDIFINRFIYFTGSESLNVASMYNNISSIFFISEEYDESELYSQNALTIYLANYGTSDSVDNLIMIIVSSVSNQQLYSITHLYHINSHNLSLICSQHRLYHHHHFRWGSWLHCKHLQ